MRLQSELDKIVFRWKAKFDMNEMEHAGPDDSKRRFVISFYMVDQVHHILVKVCSLPVLQQPNGNTDQCCTVNQSIAVYEPPVSNSGFVGGKFLERGRVRKHGTSKFEAKFMTGNCCQACAAELLSA